MRFSPVQACQDPVLARVKNAANPLQKTKRAPEGALRSFIIVSNETLSSLVRLLSSLMRIYADAVDSH
jgi:hypothetical protein